MIIVTVTICSHVVIAMVMDAGYVAEVDIQNVIHVKGMASFFVPAVWAMDIYGVLLVKLIPNCLQDGRKQCM